MATTEPLQTWTDIPSMRGPTHSQLVLGALALTLMERTIEAMKWKHWNTLRFGFLLTETNRLHCRESANDSKPLSMRNCVDA